MTGPFTVESLSPHRVSDAQEMVATEKYVQTVIDNMLKAGVQKASINESIFIDDEEEL